MVIERSTKAPTRAALTAIVRDLARGRRAELLQREEYVDDDDEQSMEDAGDWLTRALRG